VFLRVLYVQEDIEERIWSVTILGVMKGINNLLNIALKITPPLARYGAQQSTAPKGPV